MSLATLETKIRDIIDTHAGTLVLAGIQEPAVNHILENIAAALSLGDPDIVVDDRSLRISGTIDLPNITSIRAELCFELGEGTDIENCSLDFKTPLGTLGDLAVELGGQILDALKSDASVPSLDFCDVTFNCKPTANEITLEVKSTDSWKPAGDLLDIEVRDVCIKISRSKDVSETISGTTLKELEFSGEFSGTLIVGQASIEISAAFPDLVLNIDIKNLDFATLFTDLGLTEVSDFLSSFTPVDTPAFDFHLDYTAITKSFSLDFSTSDEWKILEGPTIYLKPSIHVEKKIPGLGKDPVLSMNLSGTIKIGETVVDVSASFPSPEFSLDVSNLDFTPLFSGLGLADLVDFLQSLVPESEMSTFNIHFYYKPMTSAFQFKVLASNDWLIVEQPAITFNPNITIMREYDEDSKTTQPITTTLQGIFKMGMITTSVSAKFPDPTITVNIPDITLTSLITSVGLPEISNFINSISPIAEPHFTINLDYVPHTGAYTLIATTIDDYRLLEGLDVLITPIFKVERKDKTAKPVVTLEGKIKIASTAIDCSVVLTDPDPELIAKTTLNFQAIASDLGITPLHDMSDSFSLPSDLEVDLTFSCFLKTKKFVITLEPNVEITVPYFDFSVSGVTIRVTRILDVLNQSVFSVDLEGIFTVGELPITLGCTFPGEFELRASVPLSLNLATFVGDCLQVFNVPVPSGLSEIGILELTKLDLKVIPNRPLFSAVVTTKSGEIEFVIMKKSSTEKWAVIMALPIDLSEALSMISAPKLPSPVSDSVSNSLLAISNEEWTVSTDFSIQPLQTMDLTMDIKKGINFQATFRDDLITDLLSVDALHIAGYIGVSPFVIELLATSEIEVNLGDVLFLKGFIFGIKYADTDFMVQVGANMDLRIGDEYLPLTSTISLLLDPAPSLVLSASMREEWKDPFGLKGITLNELGVDLGVTVPFVPQFGIVAEVTIGDFNGRGMVYLSGPALQLLSIEFNELNIGTIVRSLLSGVAQNIPELFFNVLDGLALEDVKFHYALLDTTVGGTRYGAGFHMKATLKFFDFRLYAEAMLDQNDGIRIYAAMDPINITMNGFEILKLTHATDPSKGPMLDLDLRQSSDNLQLMVSGAIGILGGLMTGLVDINVDETGFDFLAECTIFDLFKASLEVTGPSLDNLLSGSGEGVFLNAYMRNDLLSYIRENILEFIQGVTDSTVTELNNAQNALIAAQQDVANWDTQIIEMKALVQSEQDAVVTGLVAAQNAVTAAQNEVNKIDSQISSCYSRINTLNSQIRWWNNWYNSAPWWEKGWKWPILVYEVGWRSVAITAQYVAIGALQVAKTAAWAVLEIVKTALRIAEALVVIADPALDPRVVALVLARAAAWTVLKVAEGLIIAARAIVTGFSSLTQFVVEWGLGGAFDIKSATLTADFANTRGRIVTINADIVFIGILTNINFSFNFDDIPGSILALAGQIFGIGGVALPS